MMDQRLDRYDGEVGTANVIIVHGQDDKKHSQYLCKFIQIASDCGLVLNSEKSMVNVTSVTYFVCVYKHKSSLQP